ncbi:hypothetical protein Tco_1045352 [Tanacetum coccineum]|uniref:Uncharacterized protein n=1 Tax=Tanacetum coccineum TaxID=301880 RepID=A0ABQ5GUF3_9ASTR
MELPTDLKELPSKFTELSGEIKELKQHVKDMEIELHGDLKEIPTKLETFTSTISSLTSQIAKLKNIQWELPAEFQAIPTLVSLVQKKDFGFPSMSIEQEYREVIQACPDKSEKGWKTINDLVKTRLDQLTQTEQELKIDLNKPLKEQDPINELNELANKKRKRTSELKKPFQVNKETQVIKFSMKKRVIEQLRQ